MDSHFRTLQKKRTANFREDETKLLIQLWGSPVIQNKLFLTHRKAPVMRLLAANMQQRGFYRTPDEIKTRIRNLKCLYHRIKRTMANSTCIGTVDPDWPHFKVMDDILSKDYPRKDTDKLMEKALVAPKMEDIQIKQEIDDIDIEDNDSWATNEGVNSEYDDHNSSPPLKPLCTSTPTPTIQVKKAASLMQPSIAPKPNQTIAATKLPTILPAFSLPTAQANAQTNGNKSLPFPLLILNNLQSQNQDKSGAHTTNCINSILTSKKDEDVTDILKELVQLQKDNIDLQKQKLEVEKQRLEYDRLIGPQLVTLIPMLDGLVQRLASPSTQEMLHLKLITGVKRKRPSTDDVDIRKDNKILRSMLEEGIKKYMMIDDDKADSDNEDSCIQHDKKGNSEV